MLLDSWYRNFKRIGQIMKIAFFKRIKSCDSVIKNGDGLKGCKIQAKTVEWICGKKPEPPPTPGSRREIKEIRSETKIIRAEHAQEATLQMDSLHMQ